MKINVVRKKEEPQQHVAPADKISLLVPTRARPSNLVRLFASIDATAFSLDHLELILRIDKDDTTTDITSLQRQFPNFNLVAIYGNKPTYLSDAYNEMARVSSGDVVGYMADDIVFTSSHWDLAVLNWYRRIEDGILLLYFARSYRDLPMHGFVGRRAINLLGSLFPTGYYHGFLDYYLWDVFMRCGRSLNDPDYHLDHLHFTNGAAIDATYTERSQLDILDKVRYDRDQPRRIELANVLRKALNTAV